MGNIKSCLCTKPSTAKIIDLHRNTIQLITIPITAAELMLEQPGYLLSPLAGLRLYNRLTAMKADELLVEGTYLLIPISRVNGKVSESEKKLIDSACSRSRAKQRSSKIQPEVNQTTSNYSTDIGISSCQTRQWRPVLEPISEGF